ILIWLNTFLVLRLSSKVVSISRYCQQETGNIYKVASEIVYLGVNQPTEFTGLKKIKLSQKINLLSVSRIVPYKGFQKLINMVNNLTNLYPNILLTIAGSSPDKKYLKYLNEIKGRNIQIIVNASEEELINLYKNSDIYLTADKYLFFGMPVLEAASFNIPSISLNYAAANEVIKNKKTGFVVNDEKDFQEKLKLLIVDKNLRIKMGKEAKRFSKELTWDKTANMYLKLFKKEVN
ncbi:glycosyltransferase family 4 protein, partial [Candidatus Woesebacteria bacterium]|nr:glycosyltransferase family 4 protein [Candidatus Woesebacteria bacterium]